MSNKFCVSDKYRGEYYLNRKNNREYLYKKLAALVGFYQVLDVNSNRYVITHYTLSYEDDNRHNPENIKLLMKFLKNKFRPDFKIHYAYRLEYRDRARNSKKASGFHYHLFIIFNRDEQYDNRRITKALKKKWAKYSTVEPFVTSPRYSSETVKEVKYSDGWVKLNDPVEFKDHTQKHSLWSWLSYLAKSDPSQKLPEDYDGKSFYCSIAK